MDKRERISEAIAQTHQDLRFVAALVSDSVEQLLRVADTENTELEALVDDLQQKVAEFGPKMDTLFHNN